MYGGFSNLVFVFIVFILGSAFVFYRKRIAKLLAIQRSWFFSDKKKHLFYSKLGEITVFSIGFILIIFSLLGLADLFKKMW